MFRGLLLNQVNQEEYMNYHNISIIYKCLPINACGFTFIFRDIKIIVINNLYDLEQQKLAIIHELTHIELKHNINDKPRLICEYEAENFIKNLYYIK